VQVILTHLDGFEVEGVGEFLPFQEVLQISLLHPRHWASSRRPVQLRAAVLNRLGAPVGIGTVPIRDVAVRDWLKFRLLRHYLGVATRHFSFYGVFSFVLFFLLFFLICSSFFFSFYFFM
jgi:hypothetical protein